MLYPIWTAKAGSGGTTVSVALATQLRDIGTEVVMVDLGGDLGAALGIDDGGPGVTDWLGVDGAKSESLARLEVQVGSSGLTMIPRGEAQAWSAGRSGDLAATLARDSRAVVIDLATVRMAGESPIERLRVEFAGTPTSLMVTRACYLAMRRAVALPFRPGGVVLIREPGRSLVSVDVAEILGVPVVAEIDHDPAVARALDAGLLVRRCPRLMARQVRTLIR